MPSSSNPSICPKPDREKTKLLNFSLYNPSSLNRKKNPPPLSLPLSFSLSNTNLEREKVTFFLHIKLKKKKKPSLFGAKEDMGGKRFAVLLCAEDTEYVKKIYGGYFGVFVGMLAEEGEMWDVYQVCLGEFPDDDEIEAIDGFVITGSCNDAHGNDAWICKLLNLLKKLDSMKKKILGICFGHQVLILFFIKSHS